MLNEEELINLGLLEYLYRKGITKEEDYIETKNKFLSKLEVKKND